MLYVVLYVCFSLKIYKSNIKYIKSILFSDIHYMLYGYVPTAPAAAAADASDDDGDSVNGVGDENKVYV